MGIEANINQPGGSGGGGSGTVTQINTGTGLTGGPITGSGTVSVATNTANTLAGYNNSGVFSDVTIGTNLTLSGGVLNASGGGGSGTVTTVSVVSTNGFAGSVANPTTTPAIIISTTITGVLKGNGTAISAATAGTDYVSPSVVTAFTAQQSVTAAALTPGSTVSWNMNTAPNATLAPTASFTLSNPTNIAAGGSGVLTITQPASGGPAVITWSSDYKFPGGTKFVLSTAASAVDSIAWYSPDGNNVQMVGQAAFA